MHTGQILAFVSAALFGVSPAAAKVIVGDLSPILLAALLYLGSGAALFGYLIYRREPIAAPLHNLDNTLRRKLAGAILFGGILAPLCLVKGLATASAFSASVLLNLESVTTTVFAFFFFQEHVGLVVLVGKGLLLLGGAVMSLERGAGGRSFLSPGSFWIALACVFWGLDNCLTRDVDDLQPALLAGMKGIAAGLFNFVLAAALRQLGAGHPSAGSVLFAIVIGALCYGLSLALFVVALRMIGASRTSTFFATGPLFGVLCAVAFLGDRPGWWQWAALVVMGAGLVVLVLEDHDHEHTHEPMEHEHKHTHDAHHTHTHDRDYGPEPHVHFHRHERLTHRHKHFPDRHHRGHSHKNMADSTTS